jgi:hypothetical protein
VVVAVALKQIIILVVEVQVSQQQLKVLAVLAEAE